MGRIIEEVDFTLEVPAVNYKKTITLVVKEKETYLVLYGSGFISPHITTNYNTGDAFKKVAEARHLINKKNNPNSNCVLEYCPTDVEFFEIINSQKSIKRLDIYSHSWVHGLSLGGFKGKRIIEGKERNEEDYDWETRKQNDGFDLKRVDIDEKLYFKGNSTEINELDKLNSSVFSDDVEIYLWGCNAGGQLDRNRNHIANNEPLIKDPKDTFAQKLAEKIGKGNVFALVGKGKEGGSVFKRDERGGEYYEDGELLPANISANRGHKNTKNLKAKDYFKKFPL
ncbi:hypothetical protein [Capnocytophaga canis]|uniref:hypothetical protein n=1 Tax=Capnocytophaga canis TaxID=1848903 RepID=UPI001561F8F9|nr:hypothetical protein [Capnocytophaga canis]